MLSSRTTFAKLSAAALYIATITQYAAAQSIPISYCSTINTASTSGNASIYQSEGLCSTFCEDTYAFAILSGNQCWCSDYIPGSTTSTQDCNAQCVGYPADWCGNDAKNLFGYIRLQLSPSGTQGGSPTTSSNRQGTVTSSSPSATVPTTSATPSSSSHTSTPSSETTATTSDSSSTSSTWTPTPIVSLQTSGGSVKTVTVTPTASPQGTSAADLKESGGGSSGLGTGGAVGLTIGLVALVALVGAIVWCCIRRKRKAAAAEAAAYEEHTPRGSSAGGVPQRTMSENSRYMLGTDGQRVVEAWQDDEVAGSRRSRLMPVDPRLDPFAPVYQRGDASKSRESVATIRDDHDYSRRMVGNGKGPLRAINPDN